MIIPIIITYFQDNPTDNARMTSFHPDVSIKMEGLKDSKVGNTVLHVVSGRYRKIEGHAMHGTKHVMTGLAIRRQCPKLTMARV